MSPKFSPFVNLLIWKLHKICLLYSNFTKTTLDDVPSSCAFVDCILHNHVFIFFVYMFIRVTLYLVVAVSMTFINTFGISIDAYNIKEKYRLSLFIYLDNQETRDGQWLLFLLPFLRLHLFHRLNNYLTMQRYNF